MKRNAKLRSLKLHRETLLDLAHGGRAGKTDGGNECNSFGTICLVSCGPSDCASCPGGGDADVR